MPRAFLTESERRAVRGDEDMNPNSRSTYIARIRNRFEAMEEDARILRENRPDLYEQLHEVVCEEDIDERIARLEKQMAELSDEGVDG